MLGSLLTGLTGPLVFETELAVLETIGFDRKLNNLLLLIVLTVFSTPLGLLWVYTREELVRGLEHYFDYFNNPRASPARLFITCTQSLQPF